MERERSVLTGSVFRRGPCFAGARRYAEQLAGVGALHFHPGWQTGHVHQLMLGSVRAVHKAWAARNRHAERQLLGGGSWLRSRRCGSLGLRLRLGIGLHLRLRSGLHWSRGRLRSGNIIGGHLGRGLRQLLLHHRSLGLRLLRRGSRSWCRARGRGWSGRSHLLMGGSGGLRHQEWAAGVGADYLGACGHATHVDETRRIGKGSANIAVQARDRLGDREGRGWNLRRRRNRGAGSGRSQHGCRTGGRRRICRWGGLRDSARGCRVHGGRVRLVSHPISDQAILSDLPPSLLWGQAA